MKYLINRKKYNMYYLREINSETLHFVEDPDMAYVFKDKFEAKKVFNKLNHKEKFEIIEKAECKKKERKIVKGEKYAKEAK